MTIITQHNHALKDVTEKDISYIRLSHYSSELYEDPRLNLSIRFMPDSPYQHGVVWRKCITGLSEKAGNCTVMKPSNPR